ncbi:Abi family protein [Rhizobium leguminosarum]|uniref:Abi family protein n=1 Tax=Rhizobium leguminosarum TaxID=384 RepID=UPI0010300131|nr:Abi family protein [Rhizobium leguminosarum]TAY13737.1 Abi family protein [Rhizobium leguminosarum]
MHYSKIALTPEEHLHRLWAGGLIIDHPDAAKEALEHIGYFRLLIYMRNFQDPGTKKFYSRTKFSQIVELYTFDRDLRLLIMDAIERIEVALRSSFSTKLGVIHGPHWHMDKTCYEKINGFFDTLRKVIDEAGPSKRHKWVALDHYYTHYDRPDLPPVWVVLEKMSFGSLSQLFEALKIANRKAVAKAFNYDQTVLKSWFHSLNAIRNQCAHHGQLWNTHLSFEPSPLNTAQSDFVSPTRLYCRMVVMHLLLDQVSPGNNWVDRLEKLLMSCSHVTLLSLGFPPKWRQRSVWN